MPSTLTSCCNTAIVQLLYTHTHIAIAYYTGCIIIQNLFLKCLTKALELLCTHTVCDIHQDLACCSTPNELLCAKYTLLELHMELIAITISLCLSWFPCVTSWLLCRHVKVRLSCSHTYFPLIPPYYASILSARAALHYYAMQ